MLIIEPSLKSKLHSEMMTTRWIDKVHKMIAINNDEDPDHSDDDDNKSIDGCA